MFENALIGLISAAMFGVALVVFVLGLVFPDLMGVEDGTALMVIITLSAGALIAGVCSIKTPSGILGMIGGTVTLLVCLLFFTTTTDAGPGEFPDEGYTRVEPVGE